MITKTNVLTALARHIGKKQGIHAEHLVREITNEKPCDYELRQLREVITQLRLDGQHVCGHPSTGYFMAANDEELNETCEFLYSRSMTSLEQISAMKKISLPDLRGQLHLPT